MNTNTHRQSPASVREAPIKCLLVDDRPENLLSLSALLADSGVQLLTATSGPEALELALVNDLALALLDVQMPDMDGFELAELLRGSERTRHVPLIFVTAGATDQGRLFKGYDSGAVDFMVKPIEPRILRSKVQVFFELYRAKQQLARELAERTETLKLNETFAAILGHDLRSPLSAVQLAAMYIQRKSGDEMLKSKATQIIASGKRMGRMIGDLLDLSRARLASGIPVLLGPVKAGELVMRVAAEQGEAWPDADIQTAFRGDLEAHWDAERVVQLLSNLIGNALTHGEPGAAVQVSVDGTAACELVLAVESRGVIPAERLPTLFDPFRAREARSDSLGGLGLGLFIVRQIALAHGGEVSAHNDAAKSLTRFAVRLPRHAVPA